MNDLAELLRADLADILKLPVRIEPAALDNEYSDLCVVITTPDRKATMHEVSEWFHHIKRDEVTGEMICFIPLTMRTAAHERVFFDVIIEEVVA